MKFVYLNIEYSWEDLVKIEAEAQWLLDVQVFLVNWFDESNDIVVNTSGSTGNPKPILLSKDNIRQSAHITHDFFNLDSSKHAHFCLPAKYIAGKMMIVRALEANMDISIEEPSSCPLSEIEKEIDFVAMTPLQMENAMDNHPHQLHLINTIILGGGVVSDKLSNKIQSISTRCYQTYGMTETITHIALQQINGKEKGDHFKVLNSFHIDKDDRGCLLVSADHIYDKKVITNDLVEIINAKSFKWLGRYDNVINTGGVKVHPESIESKIQSIIDFPFFIVGSDDNRLGQKVTLCIESEALNLSDQIDLLNQIKLKLSKLESPRAILLFDRFIYTDTGKIRRRKTLSSY